MARYVIATRRYHISRTVTNSADHHVLIRPWRFNLLDPSVMRDATSAQRWLTMMQQPFSAFLLKARPRNEYKRVVSICHILARPTDSAGVLKGEVTTTVTIVQWCVRRLLYGPSH